MKCAFVSTNCHKCADLLHTIILLNKVFHVINTLTTRVLVLRIHLSSSTFVGHWTLCRIVQGLS